MRSVATVALSLAAILHSIGLSSQFDCLPNGDPIRGVSRGGHPYSPGRSAPAIQHPPRSQVIFSPPAESSHRARSRSPTVSCHPLRLREMTFQELGSVQLIPYTNPDRKFTIRVYAFPRDASIQIKINHHVLRPMPIAAQAVIITSDGEIFAIVEKNYTVLRGLYKILYSVQKRVKINIYSGEIKEMTTKEMKETPLGKRYPISRNFRTIEVADYSPQD